MCGRLNVTADPLTQLLMEAFGISAQPAENHNLAPTEPLLVIRSAETVAQSPASAAPLAVSADGATQVDQLRWWLTPSWSDGPSTKYAMFNAKSETLAEKRSFARPFRSQRCVVPVSGYYEWQKGGREKLPFYVQGFDASQNVTTGLLLAGLWDRWTDKTTGEMLESCTIVTAPAADEIAFLHHRQPVFLSIDEALAWLDHRADVADLGRLMEPHLPGGLQIDPVSSYVNNARNKEVRCTQAIAPSLYAGVDGADVNSDFASYLVRATTGAEADVKDAQSERPAGPGGERDLFD